MAYANGQIPLSALQALSTGGHMLAPAAAAFETWRIQARAAGYDMRPTTVGDAYRNLERQINVFKQRYEMRAYPYVGPYNDVRYWNGVRYVRMRGAAAARPGTSNHGKGLAIDIKNAGAFGGAYHNWMSRTGPKLGFTNTEGRSVNEPWHWVHSGAWLVNNPITGGGSGSLPQPGGNTPGPIEEAFMPELSDAEQRNLYSMMQNIAGWIYLGGKGVNAGDAAGGTIAQRVINLDRQLTGAQGNSTNVVDAIGVLLSRTRDVSRPEGGVEIRQEIADTKTGVNELKAQVEALMTALSTLAASKGLTSEEVLNAVRQGAYEGSLKANEESLNVDVTVGVKE